MYKIGEPQGYRIGCASTRTWMRPLTTDLYKQVC